MANPPANRYIPGQPPSDLSPFNLSNFLRALQKGVLTETQVKFPAQTASFQVGAEYLYPVDATSGNVTVTLPPAVSAVYKGYCIKKTDASVNTVIVTPSGSDTIDGAASKTLTTQWNWICLRSDGVSSWYVEDSLIGTGGGLTSPLTTKGDIWTWTTTNARVGVSGTDGSIPVEDSTQSAGWKWSNQNVLTAGSMILLGTQTASASSTLDFTSLLSSTYNQYIFEFEDVVAGTSTDRLFMLVSADNGATWKATGYAWGVRAQGIGATADTWDHATGQAQISICDSNASTTNVYQGVSGLIKLFNPNVSGQYKQAMWDIFVNSTAAQGGYRYIGLGAWQDATTTINAIRFKFSTGTIASGTIRLYGIAKSSQNMFINPATTVTTTGAFNYTTPANTKALKIILQGGGGDGGTGGATNAKGAGGGGAGEYLEIIVPVSGSTTYSGVVGAHATDTSITIGATTYTAAKGVNGANASAGATAGGNGGGRLGSAGGAAGSPGGAGTAATAEGNSGSGYVAEAGAGAGGGGNLNGSIGGLGGACGNFAGALGGNQTATAGHAGGGAGASSRFGQGAAGPAAGAAGGSPAANAYGAGGSGGEGSGTGTAGGAGAQGVVIIIPM